MVFFAGFYLTTSLVFLSEVQAGLAAILQLFLQLNLGLFLFDEPRSRLSAPTATLCMALSLLGFVMLQRRIASGMGRSSVRSKTLRLRRELLTALGPGVVTNDTGLTALVTGGNNGIGFETVRGLLLLGFDVYILCRNEDRALEAIRLLDAIMKKTKRKVNFVPLDLADDVSIRRAAMQMLELPHIDVLINNAGMFDTKVNCRTPPSKRENLLQVNFFGLVLFTELLLPKLLSAGCSSAASRVKPRIINLSSVASTWAKIPRHCTVMSLLRRSIDPTQAMEVNTYGLSKLLVAQYTLHLAIRTKGKNVEVCSVHPGAVLTDIFNSLGLLAKVMSVTCPILFKFPEEGSIPTLHCVATQSLESGAFYADCKVRNDILNPRCFSMKEAEEVLELVKKTVKLTPTPATQ